MLCRLCSVIFFCQVMVCLCLFTWLLTRLDLNGSVIFSAFRLLLFATASLTWPMNAWFRRQPGVCRVHAQTFLFEDFLTLQHLTFDQATFCDFSLQKSNEFSIRVWGILVQPQLGGQGLTGYWVKISWKLGGNSFHVDYLFYV